MPNGRCRLHGGKSTGPPKGNKNALKHGRYTTQSIAGGASCGRCYRASNSIVQLEGYALLTNAEKAADADHEAFDGFGILAHCRVRVGLSTTRRSEPREAGITSPKTTPKQAHLAMLVRLGKAAFQVRRSASLSAPRANLRAGRGSARR